jgi:quinol-cytochrome oxidoreductase complex cytochrome b subunit
MLEQFPLLQAAVFIVCFIAILAAFITFIVRLSRRLNGRVRPSLHGAIEGFIIGGMGLGILGMFQPITPSLYEPGFLLLLASTLAFIVWSHVAPAHESVAPAADTARQGD